MADGSPLTKSDLIAKFPGVFHNRLTIAMMQNYIENEGIISESVVNQEMIANLEKARKLGLPAICETMFMIDMMLTTDELAEKYAGWNRGRTKVEGLSDYWKSRESEALEFIGRASRREGEVKSGEVKKEGGEVKTGEVKKEGEGVKKEGGEGNLNEVKRLLKHMGYTRINADIRARWPKVNSEFKDDRKTSVRLIEWLWEGGVHREEIIEWLVNRVMNELLVGDLKIKFRGYEGLTFTGPISKATRNDFEMAFRMLLMFGTNGADEDSDSSDEGGGGGGGGGASERSSERSSTRSVSKQRRDEVWNYYVGRLVCEIDCPCCGRNKIHMMEGWECCHVVSHADGGGREVANFRVLCRGCNRSMGKRNMWDWMKEYYPESVDRVKNMKAL